METVEQPGGRRKAYRPLAPERRQAAAETALAAYRRGDWFLAHELLEPAWMGTADLAERELYQGLIKLAAAHVHQVRGNPNGVLKNLLGADEHLARADPTGRSTCTMLDLDLPALRLAVANQVADLKAGRALETLAPIDLPRPPA
ncbi:MAG TPA: DUF309 domain-containing protein [Candidatus Limnocylindrales bacterium]|nr:DUF309 domain-containing protein [Candidatus Limnocylindrales bacterium]